MYVRRSYALDWPVAVPCDVSWVTFSDQGSWVVCPRKGIGHVSVASFLYPYALDLLMWLACRIPSKFFALLPHRKLSFRSVILLSSFSNLVEILFSQTQFWLSESWTASPFNAP